MFGLPPPARGHEGNKGQPCLNFQIVDYCIQSLLDIGRNPVITTCF